MSHEFITSVSQEHTSYNEVLSCFPGRNLSTDFKDLSV